MMTLGPIAFLSPWILTALISLPAIWWLLRATPPRPQQISFPPTRLMKELEGKEHTPSRSPWWLTALRILLAALIIFALAQPILSPKQELKIAEGPVIAVVDNSWAAAKHWQENQTYLNALLDRAARASRPTAIIATANDGRPQTVTLEAPSKAKELAASIKPLPYKPDRLAALAKLKDELKDIKSPTIYWLSDGLDHGSAVEFVEGLNALATNGGSVTLVRGKNGAEPLGLAALPHASDDLKAKIVRSGGKADTGYVRALSARGDQLGEAEFNFADGARETEATFTLPLELRNNVARLEITGEQTAGAVYLLDARSQRQRVGLISGETREQSQPLLSPLYYIEKALAPYSDLVISKDRNIAVATENILSQNPSTLILADIGKLVGKPLSQIQKWVERGGVLVRFAGPRLEKGGDELLPVELRRGGRTLGGALSWSTPQSLSPFEEESIFRGLPVPKDVTVNRQVLADPGLAQPDTQVWARLQDGTPLVTAAKREKGWTVLFHVTANSDWSKLPHSGLFVEMLRRLSELSPASVSPLAETNTKAQAPKEETATPSVAFAQTQMLPPFQSLDGFGTLTSPPPLAEPIDIAQIDKVRPSAKHPPGLYGPAASPRVINVMTPKTILQPLQNLPNGVVVADYTKTAPLSLKPWMLLAALILFWADVVAIAYLSGALNRLMRQTRPASAALFLLGVLISLSPAPAIAQSAPSNIATEEAFALKAALKTRIAYVLTGNQQIDNTSHQGLDGLSRVIAARTAIEPGEPMGVNIETDELAFFPIIYWPIDENAKPLDEKTLARLDAYMKQGGLLLFDTRDSQKTVPVDGFSQQGPGALALQRLLGKLDIPRLEPVPEKHVLTKSFYLLKSFPGRWDGGSLWVEAGTGARTTGERKARRADGVSSILITSNDFASAWALDGRNRPLFPVVPGGEVQREMAFRSGINIMMYALTGNYKADQVHIPALLERLGQ